MSETTKVQITGDDMRNLGISTIPKFQSVYAVHTTSDGDQLMVCQMCPEHLMNMIFRMFQNLAESHPSNYQTVKFDPLTDAMIKEDRRQSVDSVKDRFLFLLNILEPYLLELLIRQNADELPEELGLVVQGLQTLFDRVDAVQAPSAYTLQNRLSALRTKQIKDASVASETAESADSSPV